MDRRDRRCRRFSRRALCALSVLCGLLILSVYYFRDSILTIISSVSYTQSTEAINSTTTPPPGAGPHPTQALERGAGGGDAQRIQRVRSIDPRGHLPSPGRGGDARQGQGGAPVLAGQGGDGATREAAVEEPVELLEAGGERTRRGR